MSRRLLVVPIAAVLVLLATVGNVAAKAWYEARLDTPISRDAETGTAITVGWTVEQVVGTDRLPMEGPAPVYLRLIPMTRGAAPTEVIGTPDPPGSGHFVATVVVPDGGVARIESGMRNESCAAGACERWDMPFEMTGTLLVFGPGLGAPAPPPAVPVAPIAPEAGPVGAPPVAPVAAPGVSGWAPPIALVLGIVVAGLIAAAAVSRAARHRRGRPPEPALD